MIDAHNHLDFDAFEPDRAEVVAEARARGVTSSVLAGTHPDTWARTLSVARQTAGAAVIGVHPGWTDRVPDWDALADELRARDPRGVGEIGLDRRLADSPAAFDEQSRGLRTQRAVARELDRPVVFHCVGAYPELFAVVRRDGLPAAGGLVHGWSGPPDRVDEALDLGLHVSFGPAVTRSRAPRQVASVRAVPRDRLLIETDCPDQLPSPADLPRVAAAVALALDVDVDVVARATRDNTVRLFDLGSAP